jgi:hypothetical protein
MKTGGINIKTLVVATGPSLKQEQIDYAKDKVNLVIAVNNAYELIPEADILYSSDARWFNHYKAEDFKGKKLCVRETKYATKIEGRGGVGFSKGYVTFGGNSGFAAINLALNMGAKEIYLLGFDMGIPEGKERHYFGSHPTEAMDLESPYTRWLEVFNASALTVRDFNATIYNCTEGGFLECFPKHKITEIL